MTLNNIIIRFLKENGLYGYFLKRNKNRKNIAEQYIFYSNYFIKEGIKSVFYSLFSNDLKFYGASTSLKRRKFYKLNKKWKKFVENNFVLQHNIFDGDIITRTSLFGRTQKYKVGNVEGRTLLVSSLDNNLFLQNLRINILSVENVENKELILNIYQKDNFNGKIEGNYNEVQL